MDEQIDWIQEVLHSLEISMQRRLHNWRDDYDVDRLVRVRGYLVGEVCG